MSGGEQLREHVDAAAANGVSVSVCPRSVDARGIREEQLAAIGAHPRWLSEILTEVADGVSVLVHI